METKRLIETENSIQEFTVQFYGGTVMIEQNQLPLGQISCELLDHPVEELHIKKSAPSLQRDRPVFLLQKTFSIISLRIENLIS